MYITFDSMIKIEGYKQVEYLDFVSIMEEHKKASQKPDIQIAADIEVKSPATVKNAFNKGTQMVSDKILTKVLSSINMDGFVLWNDGKANFYVGDSGG